MIVYLTVVTVVCALSSWGFAIASVRSFQEGHRTTGTIFAATSLVLGVGAILVWLFLR